MGWWGKALGWATGAEVHKRNIAFIKGETTVGPLKMKAPEVGTFWFWARMKESSAKLVEERGPAWSKKKVFGVRIGVALIFMLWLAPGLWLICSGLYGIQHRIMVQAEAIKAEQKRRREAKTAPASPAPSTPPSEGKR